MMKRKYRELFQYFNLEEWILALAGIFVILITFLDMFDWLGLSTDQLLRIILVAIGLIMSSVVIRNSRQEKLISNLENEIGNAIFGHLEVRRFVRMEDGVEYLASKVIEIKRTLDHVALSPPLPRWYKSTPTFEKAIKEVASTNKIKIRYIANFADKFRLERVEKILSNPDVNTFFVASYDLSEVKPRIPNILILDSEEIVFGIPGFGETDILISIKDAEVVLSFERYFDLLWAEAEPYDRLALLTS